MQTLTQPNFAVCELTNNEFFINEPLGLTAGLPAWLFFSFLIYYAGLVGMVINRRNFIVTMMSIELMYLGAVSSFVLYGAATYDVRGYIYGLLLLILAACESAIGLGLLIVLYRFEHSIDFEDYQHLGG